MTLEIDVAGKQYIEIALLQACQTVSVLVRHKDTGKLLSMPIHISRLQFLPQPK
ncbi:MULTISPECIES: hypothetical protein [Legionella]|uniref:Uncharacterized protein n=1 Tax=Legionella drozanskii LLAP-1 TaxID=1212489 RepID=A0A0W0SMK4_9GAMM|nr:MULTISPECIES: hypothetical protein [Legionella]KTC84647.1 hypothetical protein Ldro_2811 [Legionella drozanskii LLAP-1]